LFKFKEGKNFNRRHTLSISRIKILGDYKRSGTKLAKYLASS
jgi:hypothetical protein